MESVDQTVSAGERHHCNIIKKRAMPARWKATLKPLYDSAQCGDPMKGNEWKEVTGLASYEKLLPAIYDLLLI